MDKCFKSGASLPLKLGLSLLVMVVYGKGIQTGLLSSFVHILQLVVLKFNEDESLKRMLKRAFALVTEVNKSSRAIEKLLLLKLAQLDGALHTY